MRILFIENHEVFSRIVTNQFLSGHDVTINPSLAEANATMRENTFDLLLVDYDLDDGKGAEIVAQIASMNPRPKIIAVSSRDDGNAFLLAAGADAVCCKMDFDQIGSIIEQVFCD